MPTYIVEGMTCGGCAASVTNAIEAAITGAKVTVDLESRRVTVDGQHDADAVRQAVEDAGFEYAGAAT